MEDVTVTDVTCDGYSCASSFWLLRFFLPYDKDHADVSNAASVQRCLE